MKNLFYYLRGYLNSAIGHEDLSDVSESIKYGKQIAYEEILEVIEEYKTEYGRNNNG